MNIFLLISYLNKISLLAFFITLAFLSYQIYLFKKDISLNKEKPNIPNFQENIDIEIINYTKLPDSFIRPIKKDNNKLFLIISSVLISFTLLLFFFISSRLEEKNFNKNLSFQITPTLSFKLELTPTLSYNSFQKNNVDFLSPSISPEEEILTLTPTEELTPTPTELILSKPNPTEKDLLTPSSFEKYSPTSTIINSLPITGVIDNGLIIFTFASLLIFFSFVL